MCVHACSRAYVSTRKGIRIIESLFLLSASHQVRYLLEWTEDDLDDVDEAISSVDLEFCHPLCQCPKCAPVQKVRLCLYLWDGVERWEARVVLSA